MAKVHLWAGHFRSARQFDKYLDQKQYLEAWAAYDHGSPAADGRDREPDPALRCAFCKEVGLDSFDEDALVLRFYGRPVEAGRAARDILVDEEGLARLLQKQAIERFNAVICYQDRHLSKKDAAGATSVRYLGQLAQAVGADGKGSRAHHLWVGRDPVDDERLLAQIGAARPQVVSVDACHSEWESRVDEWIITRVEDLPLAEDMILSADRMGLRVARSFLHLIVSKGTAVEGDAIGAALGLTYVGAFSAE